MDDSYAPDQGRLIDTVRPLSIPCCANPTPSPVCRCRAVWSWPVF